MSANKWFKEIDRACKQEQDWRDKARKVIKRYRDERIHDNGVHRFNILWSNVETMRPSLYSHTPAPVVKRRYDDQDPVAKAVSEVLKRSLEFTLDEYDFDAQADQLITDYLLPGRAVARVLYEPRYGEERVDLFVDDEGVVIDEDGKTVEDYKEDDTGPYAMRETLEYEEATCMRWPWEDFALQPAKSWGDVNWIAFRSFLSKEELKKRFPKKWKKIQVGAVDSEALDDYKHHGLEDKAEVWEIWDKRVRKQYIISKNYEHDDEDGYIEVNDDPLGLEEFFPCPEPLYAIEDTDTMVPIPEFCMYQDQADELDRLTQRIVNITDALKAKGFYAGSQEMDLDRLVNQEDGILVPVADWQAVVDKGGLRGMIEWFPVEELAKTLAQLQARRQELVQTIYQLTGISDLLRGATDPRETARAQRLKAEFGSRRLALRQRKIQKFIRNILRLKAEIMAEKFEPETFEVMTGKPLNPEMIDLLRDETKRDFRIDIETDSTIAIDEEAAKQQLNDALQAVSAYVTSVGPLVQAGAVPGPVMVQLLLTYVRKFQWGSELEDAIESVKDFEPKPDAESQKLSAEQQKMQMQMQLEQQKTQAELEKKKMEAQIKMAQAEQQNRIKLEEAASKERIAEREFQAEQRRENQKLAAELRRQEAETKAKIEQEAAKAQADIQLQIMKAAAETGVSPDGKKNLPRGRVEFDLDDDGNIVRANLNG